MSRKTRRSLIAALLFAGVAAGPAQAEDWPCWRGPRLDGSSLEPHVPVHWTTTSNVLWKTELPGLGHASPIVSGDRVFTVSADPESQQRLLLCLERHGGKILWTQPVLSSPLET